jgi:hypothetical protein
MAAAIAPQETGVGVRDVHKLPAQRPRRGGEEKVSTRAARALPQNILELDRSFHQLAESAPARGS